MAHDKKRSLSLLQQGTWASKKWCGPFNTVLLGKAGVEVDGLGRTKQWKDVKAHIGRHHYSLPAEWFFTIHTFISSNLEGMTSFHYSTSFKLYSSPFYTSLTPAQWHSYCLGELSLWQRLNPNPPFVRFSPVLHNKKKSQDKAGLAWQQLWVTATQKLYPPH